MCNKCDGEIMSSKPTTLSRSASQYEGADSAADMAPPGVVYLFSGLYALYLLVQSTRGQYFEDPTKYFEPITFDIANRGGYNWSDCTAELINCWEVVRPDLLCQFNEYGYGSVCATLKETCDEWLGMQDALASKYVLLEGWCAYWSSTFKFT